jgi:hypothetical protein
MIMTFAAPGIELIGLGRDIAEQVPRMGLEPGLGRTEFERAVAETPGLVTPAELQTSARQRAIEPGERRKDSARRQTLQERLGFHDPVQCLVRLADLRHWPGGGGHSPGKVEREFPGPGHRDPALDP